MTDEQVQWASMRADGYTLMVSETSDGAVLLTVLLSREMNDMIAPRRPLMFRVDDNKPISPDVVSWQPRSVTLAIDRQLQRNGRGEFLIQLMAGQRLLMRWPVYNGGARDVEFSLAGAAPILAEALKLSDRLADGSLVRREADRRAAFARAARCRENAAKEDYSVCMNKGD